MILVIFFQTSKVFLKLGFWFSTSNSAIAHQRNPSAQISDYTSNKLLLIVALNNENEK